MAEGNDVTSAITVAASGMVAALIARRLIKIFWVAGTGKQPPEDPADPSVSTWEAVALAVSTGAVMALTRLMVQRQVARRRAAKTA